MTENGQKWPETGILDFLRKSSHYFSLERVSNQNSWSINILWKLDAWEKSDSQVMAKNALAKSDFSIFSLSIAHEWIDIRHWFFECR